MSSIAVAEIATSPSTHVPTPVKERVVLWEGGSIAVKIPLDAKRGSFQEDDTNVDFLQFARHVTKGVINIFLHGGDELEEFRGRTVVADAKLYRKTFVDGRAFLYVDLHAPRRNAEPTHRMVMVDGTSADPSAFNTPAPLKGYVIFTKPDAKVSTPKPNAERSKPAPAALKPALGGGHNTSDSQLDRLLSAGWQIEREDAKCVYLTKGAKTLTHHRPKKK